MKTSRKKNSTVNIGRWLSYAAAGAVTAIGAGNDAEGSILFSGVLDTAMPHAPAGTFLKLKTLVANSDPGVKTFARFSHTYQTDFGPKLYLLKFRGLNINPYKVHGAVVGTMHSGAFYASNLGAGVRISAAHFNTTNRLNAMGAWGGSAAGTQSTHVGHRKWSAAGTGYVGFEFNLNSGNLPADEQYGWAKVIDNGPKSYYMTLVEYAYGSPGQAITVGETGLAVPEPASLGLLALGATGLLALRMGR